MTGLHDLVLGDRKRFGVASVCLMFDVKRPSPRWSGAVAKLGAVG